MCRKGLALVVAIAMLLIASAMQLAYIALYYNNYRMAEKLLKKVKAHYYTYAAQQLALEKIFAASTDYSLALGPLEGVIPGSSIEYKGEIKFAEGQAPYEAGVPPFTYTVIPYHIWVQAPAEETSEIKASSRINLWVNFLAYSEIGSEDKAEKVFWQVVKPQ